MSPFACEGVARQNAIDLSCAVNVHPQDTFAAVVLELWKIGSAESFGAFFLSVVIVPFALFGSPPCQRNLFWRLQLVQLEIDCKTESEEYSSGSSKTRLHGQMQIELVDWFGASRPLTRTLREV